MQRKTKRTDEEMDTFIADAMFDANKTMDVVRKLASGKMQKKKNSGSKDEKEECSRNTAQQGKRKKQSEVCRMGDTNGHRINRQITQLVKRRRHNGRNGSDVGRKAEGVQH